MKIRFTYLIIASILLIVGTAKAQNYTPNVSKDSLAVLTDRVVVLKASLKIHELKIKESEEETDVEKLRMKLITANAKAKESAIENSDLSKKIASGTLDAKTIEKIAKKAKDDMASAQRALDSYNKQIKRVESIRSDIRVEEGKLSGKTPLIVFKQN